MSFLGPLRLLCGRALSWRLAGLGLAVLLIVSPPFQSTLPLAAGSSGAPDFGVLPLSFVPNAGQTDLAVSFQANSVGGTIFFTPGEVVLSLPARGRRLTTVKHSPAALGRRSSHVPGPASVVRLRFEGASSTSHIIGTEQLPGVVNYFVGNDPAGWRTHLPTFAEILYHDLYPGIDLRYAGAVDLRRGAFTLKGTYSIARGVDPDCIRWRYQGVTSVQVDEVTGDLRIGVPAQSLISERAPVAWQDIGGQRVPVDVRYTVDTNATTVGFALGDYDPDYPLTIDPTLTYSTYLGGSSYDYAWDIAVDDQGSAYVVGRTSSIDFPSQGPLQEDIGGGPLGDAFVVKLNPTGSALVYATYLGGSHNEAAYGVAVDDDGVAYLTGDTLSADFPTLNAAQPVSGGGGPYEGDAFITALDPGGSALLLSTYLGGSGDELSYGIALDAAGNAYVAGYTSSTDFPVVNAPQPDPAFGQGLDVDGDGFVTQVISASGVYTWGLSTYLGGTDLDVARDIALDTYGVVHITGNTRSDDFPTAKPAQSDYGGGSNFGGGDAFVTQVISASGVYTWGYSTYLGGSDDDVGYGISVNGSGDAYVTGETVSSDFPTRSPFQDTLRGERDAFVTKVVGTSGGTAWGYSTYLGGSGDDSGRDVTVDSVGAAYLTGNTSSPDFPASEDAYDGSCGTDGLCDDLGSDVFLTVLSGAGDALAYSTYLGGGGTDFGRGIALDHSGHVYLTGFTYSADFPTSAAALDQTCGTDGVCNGLATDAFVAKLAVTPDLSLTKSADPQGGTPVNQGDIITYTLVSANRGMRATDVVITDAIPPGTAYVPDSLVSTLGSPCFDGVQVKVAVPEFPSEAILTATFRVTVTTGLTTSITNRATLTGDGTEPLDSNVVGHPVQGTGNSRVVYLPFLLKAGGALPPCAQSGD